MSHRKPLGTSCRIHFAADEWERPPRLGDHLVSEAGTSYRITGIEEGRSRNRYVCERVAGVTGACWIYDFYWLPRSRGLTPA